MSYGTIEPFGPYKGDIERNKTCCCLSFFKALFSCGTKQPVVEERRYYNSLMDLQNSWDKDSTDSSALSR